MIHLSERISSTLPVGNSTSEGEVQFRSFASFYIMDTITSVHGLDPVYPTQPLQSADVNKLSYELTLELERLRQLFTVDGQKLKEISKRFEEELQEGVVAICSII